MPVYHLTEQLIFPPAEEAEPDGLLAIGGDLSPERLLLAYRNGIFPWFNEGSPQWWCPDPRCILIPGQVYISKSMKQVLRNQSFRFTVNQAFNAVIRKCQRIERRGQPGTWINESMLEAYEHLHQLGYAVSAEAWAGDNLVGGLYGVRIGSIFFGESMFSETSNASKFAFIRYCQQLEKEDVKLIDCQIYTPHLASLGALMIPRSIFLEALHKFI